MIAITFRLWLIRTKLTRKYNAENNGSGNSRPKRNAALIEEPLPWQ